MGIRFKKEALIAGCVIAFFILLSILILADYFRHKNALFKGLFKCAECDYAFRKEVSSKVKLPLACLKCGKKTELLAEFFCSHCQKNYVINLEIPPGKKRRRESLWITFTKRPWLIPCRIKGCLPGLPQRVDSP